MIVMCLWYWLTPTNFTNENPVGNAVYTFSCTYRLYLAAIHFNENANRPQAQTAEGVPLFKIAFPKSKKGECTVKRQKIKLTFGKTCKEFNSTHFENLEFTDVTSINNKITKCEK